MQGIPTHDERGAEISKSKRKKLIKMMKAQEKRYEKYLKRKKREEEAAASVRPPPAVVEENKDSTTIEMSKLKIQETSLKKMPRFIFGTFGNRQALKFESEMGPFTHTLDF